MSNNLIFAPELRVIFCTYFFALRRRRECFTPRKGMPWIFAMQANKFSLSLKVPA